MYVILTRVRSHVISQKSLVLKQTAADVTHNVKLHMFSLQEENILFIYKFPKCLSVESRVIISSWWSRHHRLNSLSFFNLLSVVHSSSKETQLFWTHFSCWPWVTGPDSGSCTFCQMVLRVTRKKPRCDIPHGSLSILTCLSTCHFGLMTKQLKSNYNQCKLGIFSKWCISFGQECMVLNRWAFFLILQCSK